MVDLIHKLGGASFLEQLTDSPTSLAFVEAHFRDAEQATCDALLEGVDESPYSLRDWIEALRKVEHWLCARNMTMELGDLIGYVSCATASAGAGANLTHLPSLVEEMLEAYGCERAVKK